MMRFPRPFLIFVPVLAFIFISCNGQGETSASKDKPRSPAITGEAVTGLAKDSAGEAAISPVVIRSAVPPGFYGYAPDTLQVSQYIRRIFQDKRGNLWFGTVGDGVCRYDGKTLTYYTEKDGFSGNSVQDIAEDRDGTLWFGTSGGVSKYEERQSADSRRQRVDTGRFTNFTEKDGLPDKLVFSLFIDRSGTIWTGTAKGVCRYNGGTFTGFPIPESAEKLEVRNMTEDRAGNIWFATNGGGVYRYAGGALTHISEKDGLGNNRVHCVLQDKNGNMWFATLGGGVSRYDPSAGFNTGSRAFTSYTEQKGSNEAWRLFEDKAGNIWVSVRGGVRRYDGRSFTTFTAADGLTNCCVQSIYEDRAGNLWFGSGAGLFRFDKSRANHPCNKNTCRHDLKVQQDLNEHNWELSKTFVNVTKKGPWPERFRSRL